MRHRITQRAERDLKDIYRYTVETFGHAQAEKYLRELDAVFEILGDYPNMGRIYEARTHQFVHGKHHPLQGRLERDRHRPHFPWCTKTLIRLIG